MIRLLILILSATFIAFIATWLVSMSGAVSIEGFGNKTSIPAGVAIGMLVVGAVLISFLTATVYYFAFLPKRLRARSEKRRADRGVTALARGLEAVAVGEAGDAMHHARVAERNLPDGSLTRLLVAQSAQLAGEEDKVSQAYSAMLDAPETTFLGLRGLYGSAMRQGDKDAARAYAEQAFALRPNALWAFESVLDLALDRGAWGDGLAAIASARKSQALNPDRADRGETALLTAAGAASALSGDLASAQSEAEQALKRAPSFAPAAALAARVYTERDRPDRARKILEAAYAAEPHYGLAALYVDLDPPADDAARAKALEKLAGRNHGARLSTILRAEAELLRGKHEAAISHLEGALSGKADQRALMMMGAAVRNVHGEAAARHWFDRAAARPSDASAGLDGAFTYSREGWASLVREFMDHARLAPPPLDSAAPGLTTAEIAALLPAPDGTDNDAATDASARDGAAEPVAELEDLRVAQPLTESADGADTASNPAQVDTPDGGAVPDQAADHRSENLQATSVSPITGSDGPRSERAGSERAGSDKAGDAGQDTVTAQASDGSASAGNAAPPSGKAAANDPAPANGQQSESQNPDGQDVTANDDGHR